MTKMETTKEQKQADKRENIIDEDCEKENVFLPGLKSFQWA